MNFWFFLTVSIILTLKSGNTEEYSNYVVQFKNELDTTEKIMEKLPNYLFKRDRRTLKIF